MRTSLRHISACLLLLTFAALAPACRADLFDEGKALYKAGNYPAAAAKLEQAAQQSPSDARIWWQLNFAYHKLNRDRDALNAVERAGQLDPKHTFASQPGKYEDTLQRLQRTAAKQGVPAQGNQTGSAARATGETTAGSGAGTLVQQLVGSDVYVERGMRVDVSRLRDAAQSLRPTVVKFAVFNSNSDHIKLDAEAARIGQYLKQYLNNGQGAVIASSRRAVAIYSPRLSKSDARSLTSQIAPTMEAGRYTDGLIALAQGAAREIAPRQTAVGQTGQAGQAAGGVPVPTVAHGPNWFGIFLLVVLAVVIFWLVARAVRGRTAVRARKPALERQKSQVVSDLNYLEESANSLDASKAGAVRDLRLAAGTKLDEASRILSHAGSDADLNRAQAMLDQAQGDIMRAKAIIQGVAPAAAAGTAASAAPAGFSSGGGGHRPRVTVEGAPPRAGGAGGSGFSGKTPPVYPAGQATSQATDWNQVPQDQKGVCFFCSRPMLLSELTPVTVNLGGQQQRVLACPDDLATIRTGQVPQIRAFNVGGRTVPWYAYNNYDPYIDYYPRYGYGGWGTGSFLTDMIALNAIDNMFWNWHHPMGWGWGGYGGWGGNNTYVFYPDHDNYHDYYGGQAAGYGDYSDVDRTDHAGGADFLGSTGGDLGGSDFGGSGGSDFGGDRS